MPGSSRRSSRVAAVRDVVRVSSVRAMMQRCAARVLMTSTIATATAVTRRVRAAPLAHGTVVPRAVVRAFASGGEGNNITSELVSQMRAKISEGLETDRVEVRDESGNARHVSIKVVSEMFEGKSSVNRQRLVYKCIWLELQDQVHAVNEMITLTPNEASSSS